MTDTETHSQATIRIAASVGDAQDWGDNDNYDGELVLAAIEAEMQEQGIEAQLDEARGEYHWVLLADANNAYDAYVRAMEVARDAYFASLADDPR